MDLNEALRVEIPFGKKKGQALADIVEDDLRYMGWLYDVARERASGDFKLKSPRLKEAALLVGENYADEIAAADPKFEA